MLMKACPAVVELTRAQHAMVNGVPEIMVDARERYSDDALAKLRATVYVSVTTI